jgi:hypothetical protein
MIRLGRPAVDPAAVRAFCPAREEHRNEVQTRPIFLVRIVVTGDVLGPPAGGQVATPGARDG